VPPARAPRLAIAAWLALTWSAVMSVVLGGFALAVPALPAGGGMSGLLAARARAGRSHRRGLRAAGRADAQLGAIVIDHAQPAAYCLSGPRQPVVLTSAALSALDDAQVAAVLAHERAHQAGRHHLLVAAAASLAAAFPRIPNTETPHLTGSFSTPVLARAADKSAAPAGGPPRR
jgi:Zn-dependent protease with chaperone function